MDGHATRRQLLASIFASGLMPWSQLLAESPSSVDLSRDNERELYRVRMTIDVEGNAEVPRNAITNDRVQKLGVKADSVIDYEERLFRDDQGIPQTARRYYYEAATNSKIQQNDRKSGLRKEARRVVSQIVDSRSILFAERTQFTDEELQLLQVPVNSLAIDRLLPERATQVDESWKITNEVLAVLFDLDAVQKSNIKMTLRESGDQYAKMELEGDFSAAVDGVPTAIQLRGKATFDKNQRAITWLALALREDRDIGSAEPGFDVTAQVRIIRQALDKPNAVHNAEPVVHHVPPSGDKLMVEIQNPAGGFSVFCDREWRVMHSHDRISTLRYIKNDNVVAQCDVRSLPELKEGHQLTLEAFQEDIRRTIGERFEEFLQAEEKVTSNQVRLLRVVASGVVEKIPVQWIYLHFSDDHNRRSAAIFTVSDKQLEAFGGNDLQFAEGFRFIEKPDPDQGTEVAKVENLEPSNDGERK